MTWYNSFGQAAPTAVRVERKGKMVWLMNPAASAEWREANGYTLTERPPLPEPEPLDDTAFRAACQQFRDICGQIGTAIGVEDFRGGFDEMVQFQQSPAYGTVEGLQLAVAWAAANELCKYEGQKIGCGQPDWWYNCWQQSGHATATGGEQ